MYILECFIILKAPKIVFQQQKAHVQNTQTYFKCKCSHGSYTHSLYIDLIYILKLVKVLNLNKSEFDLKKMYTMLCSQEFQMIFTGN